MGVSIATTKKRNPKKYSLQANRRNKMEYQKSSINQKN